MLSIVAQINIELRKYNYNVQKSRKSAQVPTRHSTLGKQHRPPLSTTGLSCRSIASNCLTQNYLHIHYIWSLIIQYTP